jgi:5-methyltetrahydropteroyltriglutamate--homocysteine methyltransferase
MKRSTDRILTTHTGSLPRATKVIELLLAEQQNHGVRKAELNAAVGEAIAHVVQKQIESGIDVINDGEQCRTDYTVHVLDRLAGFDGESTPPLGTGDPEFPRTRPVAHAFRLAVSVSAVLHQRGDLEGLARRASRHRFV